MELKTQTPFRPKGFILQLPATDSESNGGFLSPILYIGSCAVTASLYFRSEVPPLPLNIITIWAEELETITEGIISQISGKTNIWEEERRTTACIVPDGNRQKKDQKQLGPEVNSEAAKAYYSI